MNTPPSLVVTLRLMTLAALLMGGASPPAAQARGRSKAATKAAAAAPAAEATDGNALLLTCSRDVAVRSERGAHVGEWRDCEPAAVLLPLDRVRTGKAGLCTVNLMVAAAGSTAPAAPEAPAAAAAPEAPAASPAPEAAPSPTPQAQEAASARAWLDPGSVLQLLPASKKLPAGVALTEGMARLASEAGTAARPARALRVQLPEAELRLRGVARVELGPAPGDAHISVYDGQVEITEARGRRAVVKVAAGYGALLRRGAKARTGSLIGAPTWEGERGLFFALPQRGPAPAVADIALPFKPVQGAVRYRVEIGRDEALLDRVHSAALSAEVRRAPVRLPGRGRYYVRLQAVDSDQMSGPGPVQVLEVVEVRGERVAVGSALGSATGGVPLLQGTGELTFDLLSATTAPDGAARASAGRLQVQVDDRPVSAAESQSPTYTQVRVGRGAHRVQVRNDAGHQGELRVEVTRPSYEVELSQGVYATGGRSYRLEVRALDGAGQKAPPVVGLSARAGLLRQGALVAGSARAISLVAKAPGIYQGELEVPSGQVLRLAIADADGPLTSTDLGGSPE